MSDVYVGNNIVGNFKPDMKIDDNIQDYILNKNNGCLNLVKGKKVIKLKALDENAHLVVTNFSDEIGELNDSIYKLEYSNEIVVIILYTYITTKKLLLQSESMYLHLRREIENKFIGEEYKNLPGLPLKSREDIAKYLTDMFVNNKSIFIHYDAKNPGKFQLYGNKYRANVIMERPGVYIIDDIYKNYNKEFSFSLIQLFGNIKFVLWKDATEINGNPLVKLESFKINDVFRAWDQYMAFEKRLYVDNLKEVGIIKFKSITINGDELTFDLEDNLDDKNLSQIEFEFISAFDPEIEGNKRILPQNIDQLIALKNKKGAPIIYLGKPLNEEMGNNKLVFPIPYKNFMAKMTQYEGYIYPSDRSLQVEQRRRKGVLGIIESKKNESSNIIMKLSSPDVIDTEIGTDFNPVNGEVLRRMFGNPNVTLKETYRQAMWMALNTPDIALIQGPPGTGKTTLIKGLIARLILMNQNFKILVSAEQHEALYNVIDKSIQSKSHNFSFIPPFVASKRYDYDEDQDFDRQEKIIKEFQQNFISVCNSILREEKSKNRASIILAEIAFIIQSIREHSYGKNYILTVIEQLKEKVMSLAYYNDLEKEFMMLNRLLKIPNYEDKEEGKELDFKSLIILRKIEGQRTDLKVFVEDDGIYQMKDLQNLLEKNDFKEFLMDSQLLQELENSEKICEETFEKYVNYVENLKSQFLPQKNNIFEEKKDDVKQIIECISRKISALSKNKNKDFYDIVESLSFRLIDIESSAEIIQKYTTIIGSTCAQADNSMELIDLPQKRYDYVIIDEAARANPIDIMIPIMLGIKVILIGDHKQLPHYIENNYVNKFKNEKEKYSGFDERLLTKSLFQIIYENLEKAYKENRIKFKRTIRINEQYRMHPVIGKFISDTFYDGEIQNGEKTVNNVNDYHIFHNKNVVWVNVPVLKGLEERNGSTLQRRAEAEEIINILQKLVKKNEGRKLDVGIISFYKGQVELILKQLRESFPNDIFSNRFEDMCNTVDSYQGKEFDIVIVSGVRCNKFTNPKNSLGFIHNSPSRINVALSRAKKLLIVVGDADTFMKNEYFQKFINYVKREGEYE